MEILAIGLAAALAASISGNLWFRTEVKRLRTFAEALKKERSEMSYEARQLLHDLTDGAGMVKITRISPMDVFIRRS